MAAAIRRARTETIVTSGGTAHGPADPLRAALDQLGADILIDGVDVRPGGSMLLAVLPDGRHILSLPGNPLAAVVALVLIGWPLLRGRLGREAPELTPCAEGLPALAASDGRERAVACILSDVVPVPVPVPHQRSGMLRGIATATHLVLTRGEETEALRLPWA